MLDRACGKGGRAFARSLTLVAMHTSNGAHERFILPNYYRVRVGKTITGDQGSIGSLAVVNVGRNEC